MDVSDCRSHTSGLRLKLARIERGVSQRALARRLGVSPQRVSGLEASYRPTDDARARYLRALDGLSAGPGLDAGGRASPSLDGRRCGAAPADRNSARADRRRRAVR